ncbi:MAG: hypothetical protein KZQ70_09970, partial [gamma proteobacterium symbiont of Lucinoma myriamae]|nr:hypothetical protein [gamma proteobacterium symbiont of Lucinoma myriamae]MCU7819762.1 hypothetical protein [gamma proteobacterium symbiont of Lucinoma myriamae]
ITVSEPPIADPHDGWCGGCRRETCGYPISANDIALEPKFKIGNDGLKRTTKDVDFGLPWAVIRFNKKTATKLAKIITNGFGETGKAIGWMEATINFITKQEEYLKLLKASGVIKMGSYTTYNDLEQVQNGELACLVHKDSGVEYTFIKSSQGIACYSSDKKNPVLYDNAHTAYFNDFVHLGMCSN